MSKSANITTSLDCNSPPCSSPVLYGRRITNSHEFINVQAAVMKDLLAGKISAKEANAINRDSRKILKMFKAVARAKAAR
jgi:hypothetical protein